MEDILVSHNKQSALNKNKKTRANVIFSLSKTKLGIQKSVLDYWTWVVLEV